METTFLSWFLFKVLISFIRVTFPMNQLHLKYGQTDFDQASGSWGKNVEITRRLIFYLERLIIVRDWILNLVNLRPAQYHFLQILSWSAENAKCLAAPERLLPLADLKTSIFNLSSLAWKKVQSSPDLHFALNKVLLWKFLITIHVSFRCCLNQKKLKNLKLKNAHYVCRDQVTSISASLHIWLLHLWLISPPFVGPRQIPSIEIKFHLFKLRNHHRPSTESRYVWNDF